MKILSIGDIHGRDTWKKILEKPADKYVILGDYFDSFDRTLTKAIQLYNFKEIISRKRELGDKLILMFGNHLTHYYVSYEQYSGYSSNAYHVYHKDVVDAVRDKLLKICYLQDNFLFSHAGFTKTWSSKWLKTDKPTIEDFDKCNEFLTTNIHAFLFQESGTGYSNTGDTIEQSPLWVRPMSLKNDSIEGYIQIVGHTETKTPINWYNLGTIWLNDCLEYNKYLEIDTETKEILIKDI